MLVVWLAFYVPHRVQARQQVLESRLEDRFSGTLRILTVAGRPRGARGTTAGPTVARPALAAAGGDVRLIARTTYDEGGTPMTGRTERSGDRAPARPTTAPEPAPRTGALPIVSPARLAVLERRAAAARRRLVISATLLVLTVGAWALVVAGSLSWTVALAPTALFGVVLVLGRRAAASARRADAAWRAERRARVAARAARGVTGGPAMPRNASQRVTGRAVRGSQTATQMIPRVAAPDVQEDAEREGAERRADRDVSEHGAERGGAPASVRPAGASRVEVPGASSTEATAERRATVSGSPAPTAGRAIVPPPAHTASAGAPVGAPTPATPSREAWSPTPVPRPTYTMKPAAPRREPAPLPEPTQATGSVPAARTAAATSSAEPPSVRETHPRTDTLGLDLDEILARRRAAGQ
ncbi:hypothetical protein CLV28_1951 [Sediminihabitans luteus]|uniref:Uncharacterized protein n=1 Tax=Sediminihabitans luteus TaxID=1138585 RepID=A0A2M9CDW5_9CELL|nr:hypothetical protein CLV28_1951 [Sediminihabitans luteus]GIJ00575.1 hypothetical protein Slu03_29520 [Sediminihabitans luteus]